jgi:hypothetical protein
MTDYNKNILMAKVRLENSDKNFEFEKRYGTAKSLGLVIEKRQALIERIEKMELSKQNKSARSLK